MNARGSLLRVAGLAALALLGGLVALGGVALTGGLGDGTTTVVESSPAPAAAAPAAADGRLSISDIYDRAAPGVVQITSTSRRTGDEPRLSARPLGRATGARLGLRPRQGRPHRHELPRDRGRRHDRGQLLEPGHADGEARRQRSVHRSRGPPGRDELARADARSSSATRTACASATRCRDRQPVRARPHRDRRHRQRPPAPDHGAERLHDRPRDPDGRADQPGQLGRPAAERPRPGDRRQLADLHRWRRRDGQRRDRLRRALEHGQGDRRPADRHAAGSTARSSGSAARRSTPELARPFRLPVDAGVLVEQVGAATRRGDARGSGRARATSSSRARATRSAAT